MDSPKNNQMYQTLYNKTAILESKLGGAVGKTMSSNLKK